jgi:hypothetical protein
MGADLCACPLELQKNRGMRGFDVPGLILRPKRSRLFKADFYVPLGISSQPSTGCTLLYAERTGNEIGKFLILRFQIA